METLCRIRDLQRAINQVEHTLELRYNIGLNEGMMLCSLSETDGLTAGRLGELLGLSSSNLSKVISSVEKKGLIHRSLGTQDRRQMYFTLTLQGQQLLTTIKGAPPELPPLLEKTVGY